MFRGVFLILEKKQNWAWFSLIKRNASDMVKIKKKEKGVNFRTIYGENIKLLLEKRERIINVTIVKSTYFSVYKRCLILLIVAILNLLSLILHILNVHIITGIFILALLELYRLCVIIKEENVVVVKNLGFHLTARYVIGIKSIFIPWEQVQTVFINEVIFRQKVIYVLSLLTKDVDANEKLVPVFFDTLPRLECLKMIYKSLKELEE
ncbi:hypothetical protein NQ318_004062 [Aromia moschata]|uniref:Phosphatidylinositol N-acetylglucosaminyltransferase subunit H conserved domain-containing protein n=1 Tax=Aromia moschata TaxID=1265417 RepID=A0AAV8ZAX9_9CUCU|nr:hypothetical protein NQ318_004062 [Aromia moschata]